MSKFTKPEKSWILYDVANSAFTMLISTTIPIFFRSLAEQDVSASTASGIWALTTSVAVLILAVFSLYFGFTSSGVDNAAHLGGFLAGFILAVIVYHPRRKT